MADIEQGEEAALNLSQKSFPTSAQKNMEIPLE